MSAEQHIRFPATMPCLLGRVEAVDCPTETRGEFGLPRVERGSNPNEGFALPLSYRPQCPGWVGNPGLAPEEVVVSLVLGAVATIVLSGAAVSLTSFRSGPLAAEKSCRRYVAFRVGNRFGYSIHRPRRRGAACALRRLMRGRGKKISPRLHRANSQSVAGTPPP